MIRRLILLAFFVFSSLSFVISPAGAAPGSDGGGGDHPSEICPTPTRVHPFKDYDGDRLSDCVEDNITGTKVSLKDTDYDGLSDGEEVLDYGTDPLNINTDGDAFGTDGGEVNTFFTDPLVPDFDADGDGLSDGAEITLGLDPANSDTDGDGLLDLLDSRCPGIGGWKGYFKWDKPLFTDYDSDGLGDYYERNVSGTSGCEADSDSDGASDPDEINSGNDPMDAGSFP